MFTQTAECGSNDSQGVGVPPAKSRNRTGNALGFFSNIASNPVDKPVNPVLQLRRSST
jgi:hypothetical protein